MAKVRKPIRAGRSRSAKRGGTRKPKPSALAKLPRSLKRVASQKSIRAIDVSASNLVDEAKRVLDRSHWREAQQEQLSRTCRELVSRLQKTCPDLIVGRPLKPSEVAGEIAINPEDFQEVFKMAAGAADAPRAVWSDGTNELLIELAKISLKIEQGLIHVQIPVACEETGRQTISVTFAVGSDMNPAGLIFATDTIPNGPSQIVAIWGEALVSFAWTSVQKAIATLADVAGSDRDGAGLVPAAFEASGTGVKLMVMARHDMDRVVK
jgi:hypothetical protein